MTKYARKKLELFIKLLGHLILLCFSFHHIMEVTDSLVKDLQLS